MRFILILASLCFILAGCTNPLTQRTASPQPAAKSNPSSSANAGGSSNNGSITKNMGSQNSGGNSTTSTGGSNTASALSPSEIKFEAKSLIGQYEQDMIEAINQNNFSIVSADMVSNSPIYQTQNYLVHQLAQQGVHEKLNSYAVSNIKPIKSTNQYTIDVKEVFDITFKNGSTKTMREITIYTMAMVEPLPLLTDIQVESTATLSQTRPTKTQVTPNTISASATSKS